MMNCFGPLRKSRSFISVAFIGRHLQLVFRSQGAPPTRRDDQSFMLLKQIMSPPPQDAWPSWTRIGPTYDAIAVFVTFLWSQAPKLSGRAASRELPNGADRPANSRRSASH